MKRNRCFLVTSGAGLAALTLGLVLGPPVAVAGAQETASDDKVLTRFGMHEGYDRLVLDWPEPVRATVTEARGLALVEFPEPARLDLARLNASLPPEMRPARLKPNKRGLTFRLPADRRLVNNSRGKLVILDLFEAPAAAPESKTMEAQTEPTGTKAAEKAPAGSGSESPAAASGSSAPIIKLAALETAGSGDGKLVNLQLAEAIPAAAPAKGKLIDVRPRQTDPAPQPPAMPQPGEPAAAPAQGKLVDLQPAQADPPAPEPPAMAEPGEPGSGPAQGKLIQVPSASGAADPAGGASQGALIAVAPAAHSSAAAPPPLGAGAAADAVVDWTVLGESADHELQVATLPLSDGFSLKFAWNAHVKAAVFKLRQSVWVVFNLPERVALSTAARPRGLRLPAIAVLENPTATVFRVPAPEDARVITGRAGDGLWLVDVRRPPPDDPNAASPGRVIPYKDGVFLTRKPGQPVTIVDPESSEVLLAVPVFTAAAHFDANFDFRAFHVLPTSQGMLFRPQSDAVQIAVAADGAHVTVAPSMIATGPTH